MLSLYEFTIPVFIKNLRILENLLKRGSEHSAVSNDKLFNSRLIEDMGNLAFQIQTITKISRWTAEHLAKKSPPVLEDNEKTYDDLYTRIDFAVKILESLKESDFPADDDEVKFTIGTSELSYTAKSYVLDFAYPNFYFHFVTAYDLLRKEGVEIGKGHFMGVK